MSHNHFTLLTSGCFINMNQIHISGSPGSGKTSICLMKSNEILSTGGRVFWISNKLDSVRFSQIMENIPIQNASKFHSMEFSDNSGELITKDMNSFDQAIIQLIIMSTQLTTTKLIVIDGWDYGINSQNNGRLTKIKDLKDLCDKNNIQLYLTSQSYEDASNNSEKYRIRSKTKFENMGFENWLITPHDKLDSLRLLIKEKEELIFKMVNEGIEFID